MPTTAITPQTFPSPWATSATAITWTAADSSNGNHVAVDSLGAEPWILLARNVHAANTYTVAVTSVALPTNSVGAGRTGDVAATNIAAGAQKIIKLTAMGWKNSSDQIAFTGNNSSVEFAFFSG